jgi:hypothetical protein
MPLQAPRVQGSTLKRPFEEVAIKEEHQSGRQEGGSRGSPLGKKNPPRDLLVKNGTIVIEPD